MAGEAIEKHHGLSVRLPAYRPKPDGRVSIVPVRGLGCAGSLQNLPGKRLSSNNGNPEGGFFRYVPRFQ
jgi:hypothetical protein